MQKEFIVYVKMARSKKMSTGVSSNMKTIITSPKALNGFEKPGSIKIIYYEIKKSKRQAIAREKELKSFNKNKLISFIRYHNPDLLDLGKTWIEENTYFTQNVLFLT